MRGGVPVVEFEVCLRRRQTGNEALHRQGFQDDAGRKWQHRRRCHAEQVSHRHAGRCGQSTSRLTGTGIGIAGIDHERADFIASGQSLLAQLHRCCTETVLGEHTGDRTAGVKHEQTQIAPVFLANTGLGNTEANAGDRQKVMGSGRSVVDRHV